MVSSGLVGILSQTLLPRIQDVAGANPVTKGRVLALEVLVNTPAIANLIREGRSAQIYSTIQTGGALGMQTLEASLAYFVKQGVVDINEALAKSSRADDLQRLIGGGYATAQRGDSGKGFGRF